MKNRDAPFFHTSLRQAWRKELDGAFLKRYGMSMRAWRDACPTTARGGS